MQKALFQLHSTSLATLGMMGAIHIRVVLASGHRVGGCGLAGSMTENRKIAQTNIRRTAVPAHESSTGPHAFAHEC